MQAGQVRIEDNDDNRFTVLVRRAKQIAQFCLNVRTNYLDKHQTRSAINGAVTNGLSRDVPLAVALVLPSFRFFACFVALCVRPVPERRPYRPGTIIIL